MEDHLADLMALQGQNVVFGRLSWSSMKDDVIIALN